MVVCQNCRINLTSDDMPFKDDCPYCGKPIATKVPKTVISTLASPETGMSFAETVSTTLGTTVSVTKRCGCIMGHKNGVWYAIKICDTHVANPEGGTL